MGKEKGGTSSGRPVPSAYAKNKWIISYKWQWWEGKDPYGKVFPLTSPGRFKQHYRWNINDLPEGW